ncbi:DUF2326 domain-containing protein [Sinorhizobium meliloti]|uniref:DUF2326 domain-containing protein n=1 Tax=Rhizobium meliloti TaxID=382 RepID=UPI0002F3D2B0|nr:DUF2326 domain-containing protein [Sinorhizobium meliloti]MDE3767560.1 DUF2326 domain-containing protein [Sinorhizobium meliloti]MDE3779810.1 DUF2326 domain-containing protein [Sinorhizobium meliloti]MDE3807435.1 DUF2326 domain-containing protein [Sinorhizobium meliloti]
MIHGLKANKQSFRPITFTPGVNLILADRSAAATDKDTTNALGKSTLVDIIDFCLGSSVGAGQGLRVEPLSEWSFTLDLTLAGKRVSATRAVGTPGLIGIEGATDGWPIQPKVDKKTGIFGFDVKTWRTVIGWGLFGLLPNGVSTYRPSPRSLLSYFIRSQPSAYIEPFKHFANQKTWDVQVHNAFLLGLDWSKAARWQVLKDQKTALDALKSAIKTGAIDGELATLGDLEAQRLQLEDDLEQEGTALSSFQVLPQYRQIEREANQLTSQIHALVNASIADKRRIERYNESLVMESTPDTERLEALYREAGVSLPGAVARTLEEARQFNRQIVENRRHFVAEEIARLVASSEERDLEIKRLTEERARHLAVISGHGALEELTLLQEQHALTRQKLESIKQRLTQLRQLATRADEIKVEVVELKKATELDYEERRPHWSKALRLFSESSQALYKVPGRLVIDIDDTGYRFSVDIPGSPSEGISKMKIFCYDLTTAAFARDRGLGIDFLVHDSTIFDGVDPRQRAHAIELAATRASQYGFQYILTMNTDMVPTSDFSSGFGIDDLVRLRLKDTDPSGSLLGFRY